MTKKIDYIYVCCLTFLILGFIIFGEYGTNVISAIDNKYLTEFPDKLDEDFTANLGDYVQDRIGFRKQMIALYTNFNYSVFHILPDQIYGKEGELFPNGDSYIESYQNLDGDEEWAEYFVSYICDLQKVCDDKNIEFMYILAPDKKTVYPEKMPDCIGRYPAKNLIDLIKEKVNEEGINHLFIDEIFANDKDEYQYFYKKYDVAHWSDYGRLVGMNAVLNKLSEDGIRVFPVSITNDFISKKLNQQRQMVSSVIINEELTGYSLKQNYYKEETIQDKDLLEMVYSASFGRLVNENNAELPKLLILCDSYLMSHLAWFGNNFSEIIYVHAYDAKNIQRIIEIYEPDIVLFENVERVMSEFYPKEHVKTFHIFPPYETYTNLPKEEELYLIIDSVNNQKHDGIFKCDTGYEFQVIKGVAADLNYTAGAEVYLLVDGKVFSPVYYVGGSFEFIIETQMLTGDTEVEFVMINEEETIRYTRKLGVIWD